MCRCVIAARKTLFVKLKCVVEGYKRLCLWLMLTLLRNVFRKSNAQHNPQMPTSDYSPTREGIDALNKAEGWEPVQDFDSRNGAIQASPTAHSGYTITTGQSTTDKSDIVPIVHVRANLQQRWVSALDALEYLQPNLQPYEIVARMQRLPRAALIKAMWPAITQGHRRGRPSGETGFDAIAFDNLYMLFVDEPCSSTQGKRRHKQACLDAIEAFVNHMHDVDVHGIHSKLRMGVPAMMLVTDTRKSQPQIRYERDVRERITKGPEYYSKKRARDATFRSKKDKPVPQPVCTGCGKQGFHYSFCRQFDATS